MATLADFLNHAPTHLHAVSTLEKRLRDAGFTRLEETAKWSIEPEGKYYVVRNRAAIIAFRAPVKADLAAHGCRIAAAHTDSPTLKLRMRDVKRDSAGLTIGVDIYGGMTASTWLDRPLGIAGRIMARRDGVPQPVLVQSAGAVCTIPTPPPHLLRSAEYTAPVMRPCFGECGLEELIASLLPEGCEPAESGFIPEELYLCDVTPAAEIGLNRAYLQAPRLDNLSSCFTAAEALINSSPAPYTQIAAFFNLEEVGSTNFDGARSNFLAAVLERIAGAFNCSCEDCHRMRAASWLLSADAAHAFNPNFPQLFDRNYTPVLGGGVAVKTDTNQHYATTLSGEEFISETASRAGIKLQHYAPAPGGSCGSTIGPGTAAALGIPTVDLGIPLWAMHSLRETAAVSDVDDFTALFRAFWK